jgi:nucleoside-diphosphate-sugar epimerase
MSNVLVTGAAGFIGYALADELSRREDTTVFVVDNFVRGEGDSAYSELCARDSVVPYDLDLTDRDAVGELPESVDVIFHMAALNGTQNFYERPYEVVRCSTLPTFHLLDRYGPNSGLKRFVYAGSSEAYASTVSTFNWPVPTAEDVPLCITDPSNLRWSYGGSKLHGEILVTAACRQYSREYTIIRYHNVYGPRMGDKHVIPDFLMRMKDGIYSLYGHSDTRSFIYVDDAVAATLLLADCADAANETVNVGSENEMQIADGPSAYYGFLPGVMSRRRAWTGHRVGPSQAACDNISIQSLLIECRLPGSSWSEPGPSSHTTRKSL